MTKTEKINDLQDQLNETKLRLKNYKKAIPKIILVTILANFVIPLFPHGRIIKLVAEKGYWGAILFGAPILLIVVAIVIYFQYSSIKEEIEVLQKKININCRE